MELVLVRHAQPEHIEHSEGPADPPLTALGQQQAERTAAVLAAAPIDLLVTSPQRRAAQTAAALARLTGTTPRTEDHVAEFDRDGSSYVPVEELRARGGAAWQALASGSIEGLGPDGPAWRQRVIDCLEGLVAEHPGGRVVVACHAGVVNVYTGWVLGQQQAIWFAPGYASITRVGCSRSGRRGLVSLNETAHLL